MTAKAERKVRGAPGTFYHLVQEFFDSPDYLRLATQIIERHRAIRIAEVSCSAMDRLVREQHGILNPGPRKVLENEPEKPPITSTT